jgi:hypothetical protein
MLCSGFLFDVLAAASSGLPVVFSVDPSSVAICTLTAGSATFQASGVCVLVASQQGNATFNAAPQIPHLVTVSPGSQSVAFTTTLPGAAVGGPSYTPAATSSVGLPVTITVGSPTICSISNGVVSFLAAGICALRADQAGTADYNAAIRVNQPITVAQGTPSVTFSTLAPVGAQVQGAKYVAAAASSSGLAVVISSTTTAVCTVSSGITSFLTAGSCTLLATQSATANWAAASLQQTFTVFPGTQTISFTSSAPLNAVVGGSAYSVSATSTSGLAVAFAVDPSTAAICSIAGTAVSFTKAGTCKINGLQSGDSNFLSASPVPQLVSVGRGTQTVSFTSTAPSGAAVAGAAYNVTASSSIPANVVTISVNASAASVCSVANGKVTFQAVGNCVLVAQQLGTADYQLSAAVTQSFAVGRGAQTLSFVSSPSNAYVNGSAYTVIAPATSGLPATFTVAPQSALICDVVGSSVSFTSNGTCTILADQAGSVNYFAAQQISQSFNVSLQPVVVIYVPSDLFVCADTDQCSQVTSSLFSNKLAAEANASSVVAASVAAFSACFASPLGNGSDWLSTCNLAFVSTLFGLNADRVENLNTMLSNAITYRASCTTSTCRDVLNLVIDAYTPVAVAAASTCSTATCRTIATGSAALTAGLIVSGDPSGMDEEKSRFERTVGQQTLQQLQIDTFAYAQCSDDGCRATWAAKVNESFAVNGYVNAAIAFGVRLSNETFLRAMLSDLDANFTRCTLQAGCTYDEANIQYRTKRALFRFFTLWNDRLQELTPLCNGGNCSESVAVSFEWFYLSHFSYFLFRTSGVRISRICTLQATTWRRRL